MPRLILFSFLVLWLLMITLSECSENKSNGHQKESMKKRYQNWLQKHGRGHLKKTEWEERFGIYKSNVQFIDKINAQNKSYKLTDNRFADMTDEEFRAIYLGFIPKLSQGKKSHSHIKHGALPANVDWRKKGAVSPIRAQGSCGLATAKEYPYTANNGICHESLAKNNTLTISDYANVPPNDEKALQAAVAQQPVSVAIDGASRELKFYSGGIFTGYCGTRLNHGVNAIGYGVEENGGKYWLVRNTWGTKWGENGYAKFKRDVTQPQGTCGIAMMSSYPIK
ncbi:hypothetical protein ACFE04_018911 [Oxalis oulophora]